jgi:hypothetical protein
MGPKSEYQVTFFFLPAHPRLPGRRRGRLRVLAAGPGMQHLVPQLPHRLQRPALSLVGRLHLAGGILDDGQDQVDPGRQLRLGLQSLGQA